MPFVFFWFFGPFASYGHLYLPHPVTPMSFRWVPVFRIDQFAGKLPHFTWPSFPRLFSGTSSPGTSFRFLLWFCCGTSLLYSRPNLIFQHAFMSPDQCLYAVLHLFILPYSPRAINLHWSLYYPKNFSLTGFDQFCGILRKWQCCALVQKKNGRICDPPSLPMHALKGSAISFLLVISLLHFLSYQF